MPETITDLAEKLYNEARIGIIDLRYSSGRWTVFVPMGNIMVAVPGHSCSTPEEALNYCLERWRERGPGWPFLYDA